VSKRKEFCPNIDKCEEGVGGDWFRYYCTCYWTTCPYYRRELIKLPRQWREEGG